MTRNLIVVFACGTAALAQSQNSKDPCATQSAEVEKLRHWVAYAGSVKSSNLAINEAKLAKATSMLEKCRSSAVAETRNPSSAKGVESDSQRSGYSSYISPVPYYIPPMPRMPELKIPEFKPVQIPVYQPLQPLPVYQPLLVYQPLPTPSASSAPEQTNVSDVILPARKIALVIGNAQYLESSLANPVHDAQGMQAILSQSGFTVSLVTNADKKQLARSIDQFVGGLRAADLALFYYSGHGAQINGENFMLPVDLKGEDETEYTHDAASMSALEERLSLSDARLSILIFDACRNNPLERARSFGRGLAPMTATAGTFVAFATGPGQTADDNGPGKNGLFTGYLIETLTEKGLTLDEIFNRVQERTRTATRDRQIPWHSSTVNGTFYFIPPVLAPVSRPTGRPVPTIISETAARKSKEASVLGNKPL
jgi:hypothetical protein